jgi:hypothetical protein
MWVDTLVNILCNMSKPIGSYGLVEAGIIKLMLSLYGVEI